MRMAKICPSVNKPTRYKYKIVWSRGGLNKRGLLYHGMNLHANFKEHCKLGKK